MNNIPSSEKIDLYLEVKAIVDFTLKHWGIKDPILFETFVQDVFEHGQKLGKNNFNTFEFTSFLRTMIDPNNDRSYLRDDSFFQIYDLIYQTDTIKCIMENTYSYADFMPPLLKSLKNKFSTLKLIKPIDWIKFKNNSQLYNYHDYPSDIQDDNIREIDSFNGSPHNVSKQSSYPADICCNSVLYAYERDRNPFETLVGAIITQAYNVEIHNNTASMIQELNVLYQKSLTDNTMNLENTIPLICNNTLKILFELTIAQNTRELMYVNNIDESVVIDKKPFQSLMDILRRGSIKETPEEINQKEIEKQENYQIIFPLISHLYNEEKILLKNKIIKQ